MGGKVPTVLHQRCTWWLEGAQHLFSGPLLGASGEAASSIILQDVFYSVLSYQKASDVKQSYEIYMDLLDTIIFLL